MIKIGDKVKCLETAQEGIVTSRAEYLDGRIRFGVQSEHLTKQGDPVAPKWFDGKSLAVLEPKSMSMG